METSWKSHLESKGAVIVENSVVQYGNEQQELASINSENKTIVADLSHYGIIKISGSDAQSFLQSQFSNDVNQVTETQAQINSYCSPKGRILAVFKLFQINNDYFLQLPKSLLDSIIKRLTMFKMRADVDLSDVSGTYICIGLSGSSAESIVNSEIDTIPLLNYACKTNDDLTIIRLDTNTQSRFILFGQPETLIKFWSANNSQFTPIGTGPWSLLDINAGIPSIVSNTVDTFLPQMVNLQLINAVSFKKGCYPGQEIVARTQYLGKLKKRMYLIKSQSNQVLDPGTDLTTENASDDQSKGKIVNCQLSPNGGVTALAVLQINSVTDGNFIVKSVPDIKLTIENLPYSFEESDSSKK